MIHFGVYIGMETARHQEKPGLETALPSKNPMGPIRLDPQICSRWSTRENERTCLHISSRITAREMFELPIKQFFNVVDFSRNIRLFKKDGSYKKYVCSCIVNRFQWSMADDDEFKGRKDFDKLDKDPANYDSGSSRYISGEDDFSIYNNKWKPDIAWIAKAIELALQLWKWVIPTGNGNVYKPPPTDRLLSEIFASIQRSKLGIQDWSLSDLTVGLYLIYLQQASTDAMEDANGELISSEAIVQNLIYHTELAKGTYKDNATGLARNRHAEETCDSWHSWNSHCL